MGYTTLLFVSILLSFYTANGQSLLSPETNPVIEGDDFRGNCTRTSGSSSIIVRVNGVSGLVQSETLSPFLTTFTFANTTRDDNGTILTCNIPPNFMVIASLTLEVLFSPNYTAGIFDEEVVYGMPFSRILTLKANPDVGNNFTWTRDGMEYTGMVTATSINIPMVTFDDAGEYTVTATNTIGSANASFSLTVIPCSPMLLGGSNNTVVNMTVAQDSNFTINCNISDSCPLPTNISLTVDGQDSDLTNTRVMMFPPIQTPTSYTCRADNGRTVSIVYMVIPTSLPTASSSFTVQPTTSVMPTVASTSVPLPIGIIVGVVVGVSVLACVISILVPVLICCCLGVGVFATVGCLAKNKKKEVELAKL